MGNSAAMVVVVVLGCTGVGKTKLSIALAKRFNGEIINCDAMQVSVCGQFVWGP